MRVVSTHSHPKVAAEIHDQITGKNLCFNTQPPEGGCATEIAKGIREIVSTHSHPKVAA